MSRYRWRYDNPVHRRLRKSLAPLVAAGGATCSRCRRQILPGERWHLDHSDDGRTYNGPAHAVCNMRAGGLKSHGRSLEVSRRW